MSISGNLKTMELSELLQWLAQGKTGTLIVDNRSVQKRVVFRDGRIIASSSTDPREHLGHFLVGHGFINEPELAKAIEVQQSSKMLLGKILVTIGAISQKDLHQVLRLKAEESIYDMFSWSEGEFRFIDDQLPERGMVPMSLEVTATILQGLKRLDEWQAIRGVIPSPTAIPVAIGFLDDPELSPGSRRVLSLVNDDRTVEEICLETHSSEFHVCWTLYEQVQRGRIKIIRPRGDTPTPSSDSPSSGLVVDAGRLIESAEQHVEQGDYERGLRHLRAARSLEPDKKEIEEAIHQTEVRIRQKVEERGLHANAVPHLSRTVEELIELKVSPQAGFLLSRINGSYDVQSILKICPMSRIDSELVMLRLLEAGHIRLEKPPQ